MNKSHRIILKIIPAGLLIVILCFTVAACGKKEEISYPEKAEEFLQKLQTYDARINSIDPKSPGADKQLLTYLDSLAGEFSIFADYNPPAGYAEAKEHAQNASKCMNEAVSCYHAYFENETPDDVVLQTARIQYENAVIEIKNVGISMQNAR